MGQTARLVAAGMAAVTGLMALAPAVILAGAFTWPTGCKPSSFDDKAAAKFFRDPNYMGNVEAECGSPWASIGSDDAMADPAFNGTEGGGIDNMNDAASSIVLFNRANFGICFLFYGSNGYDYSQTLAQGILGVWVPAKPAGSKYRYLYTNRMPGDPTRLTGPDDAISSARAGNADAAPFLSIDSENDCITYQSPYHWANNPTWSTGVVN